jgi:hypothetical protein
LRNLVRGPSTLCLTIFLFRLNTLFFEALALFNLATLEFF